MPIQFNPYLVATTLLFGALILALVRRASSSSLRTTIRNSHVLITGGSSGIGLALAEECIRRGASHITLLARNKTRLAAAQTHLLHMAHAHPTMPVTIHILSADTTDAAATSRAIDLLSLPDAERHLSSQHSSSSAQQSSVPPPIDLLICNAGASTPGRFLSLPLETFHSQMELNYFGTIHTLRAVLPSMLRRRRGAVMLVSSALGVCGFSGYSAYAPTKWALRGLGDCLRNELIGTGVRIMMAYPPDTDTPGFAEENLTKPVETHRISQAGSLASPQRVASVLLRGVEGGGDAYHLPTPDLGQRLLIASMSGITPRGVIPLWLDFLLAPWITLVLRYLSYDWDGIVWRVRGEEGVKG